MKFGISIQTRGPTARPDHLTTVVRHAEEAGFHSVVLGDHIVFPKDISSRYPYSSDAIHPGSIEGETLEKLTLLTFIAGKTRRIRIVTGVMISPNRNPVVAAKTLASMDILSEGRLIVGVGAGWMREEFEALGLPPFEERGAVSNEYIRAFKELWTKADPCFRGKYCSFSNIRFEPKPVQKPHPPIWIGGESPAALRRAAVLGDGWHPIGLNPRFPLETLDQLRRAMRRLDSLAIEAGRNPRDIEVAYRVPTYELDSHSHSKPFIGGADEVAGDVRAFAEIGVGHLVFDFRSNDVNRTLELIDGFANKVMPRVEDLE